MLFSSCNPKELPLCVSLAFLPSGKIYGYGHCFCWGAFVPGGCRWLPHTKIELQDSHTIHEKPRILGCLMRGCILETLSRSLLIYTVEVFSPSNGGIGDGSVLLWSYPHNSEQRWQVSSTPIQLCDQKTSPLPSWIKALKQRWQIYPLNKLKWPLNL